MSNPIQTASTEANQFLAQALNRLQFGDLTGAQKLLNQSIKSQPSAEAYYQLGNCLRRLHKAREAETAFKQAIEQDPSLTPAWFGLCFLYDENGRKEDAAEYLSKLIGYFSDNLEIKHQAGGLLADFGLYKEAAVLYEDILKQEPQARSHLRLGQYYQKLGRYEEAAREFTAAIDGNPDLGAAYLLLANTRRFTGEERDQVLLRRFTAAVKDPGLSRATQICLNFALGKMHDDLDAYDTAFHYFARGNAQRHDTERFAADEWYDIARQIEQFRPSDIAPMHKSSSKGPKPLFVVGMLRSGTTLLERILASHPQVVGLGETSWLNLTVARAQTETTLAYPACVTHLQESMVDELRDEYLRRWPKSRKGATYMVDKNPANFLYLGLVARIFPDARIVHCQRDARDAALSVFFQNFANTENVFAYDLSDIAHFHNGYTRMMRHWERMLPRGMLHAVRYEDLVADLEGQTRALLNALELPWDDRCLMFAEQPGSIATASVWQARQPLYTRSVGRWRLYEQHLGPLLKTLSPA